MLNMEIVYDLIHIMKHRVNSNVISGGETLQRIMKSGTF